jgi:hypothetical protein
MRQDKTQTGYTKYQNRIEELTDCREDYLVAVGQNCEPTCNILKRSPKHRERAKYVVKVFEAQDLFMVWDCARHREYKSIGAAQSAYSSVASWEDIKWGESPIIDCYKQIGSGGAERPYEKVLIVRMSFFDQFFMNCEEYMSFNEFDEHFPCNNGNAINAAHKWSTQRVRQRYSTSRLSRDASFSKQVLEAYGYRCAICGCDIREMLQAAHEHGYTVAETSYDDPAHGVCLCANHHLLYDSDMLIIDLPNKSYMCKSEICNRKWYAQYFEKKEGLFVQLPVQGENG